MKPAKRFMLCCLGVPLLLACTDTEPQPLTPENETAEEAASAPETAEEAAARRAAAWAAAHRPLEGELDLNTIVTATAQPGFHHSRSWETRRRLYPEEFARHQAHVDSLKMGLRTGPLPRGAVRFWPPEEVHNWPPRKGGQGSPSGTEVKR